MQTRDQKYAVAIAEQVQQVKEDDKATYRKYGVMCHKLPILIHTAGLAQALAFVESRKEPIYKTFLTHLGDTVGEKDVAIKARTVELNDYMRLTAQIMAALVWYKRFAQSILGVDVSDVDDEQETK
jgi:CRISPR-associated protein Cmr5